MTAGMQEEFSLQIQSKLFSKLAVRFLAASLVGALPGATAFGQDSSADLSRAVRLFEQGDYLSAQEVLAAIERDGLSAEQQALRDDYMNRTQTALQQHEKALRDIEDAETAADAGESDRAMELAGGVLANEYAPETVRDAALALQRRVDGGAVAQVDDVTQDQIKAVRLPIWNRPGRLPPRATKR
jgi:hypothetical protein